MADTEVENILREIRERVYDEQEVAARSARENGDAVSPAEVRLEPVDSLPRLESYLTTTARAWDRLPPLVSNRSGAPARIELWLKRHFKRATRWYAWEQINFNAAVHHALTDIGQLLAANQKTIETLRAQLHAERETRQAETETFKTQVKTQLHTQLNAQQTLIAEQLQTIQAESAAISTAVEAQAVGVDERLAAIVNELRETVTALREEERVCLKQLALETSEAAILEDRARRKVEALLEQLQQRIKELETRKS